MKGKEAKEEINPLHLYKSVTQKNFELSRSFQKIFFSAIKIINFLKPWAFPPHPPESAKKKQKVVGISFKAIKKKRVQKCTFKK
jgi:hypothetical protein